MIIVIPSFSKSSVFKMFSVNTRMKIKPALSKFLRFEEKLRFRDGSVWLVGVT